MIKMKNPPRVQVIKTDKTVKPDLEQIDIIQDQIKEAEKNAEEKTKQTEQEVKRGKYPSLFSPEMMALLNKIIFNAIGKFRRAQEVWSLDDSEANLIGKASARWCDTRLGPYIGFLAPEVELLAAYISVCGNKLIIEKFYKGQYKETDEEEYEEHPLSDDYVEE